MTYQKDIEYVLAWIALAFVILGSFIDIYIDVYEENGGLGDVILDLIIGSFVAGTLVYIILQRPLATKMKNQHLEKAIRYSNDDLKKWKSRARGLLSGLGSKINEQFDDWLLTKAEKEVALLLIKGISSKEIASIRQTREKTVRQQASQIYAKARVENRSALSAFFLEDLLLPQTESL